jgi:hypothetical protein
MRHFRGIVESNTAPSNDVIWIKDGEMKYYNKGKWELLNEKFSLPEMPKYDNPIILEEGTSKDIKESNLNKLKETNGTFFVHVNHGYGVGIWSSTKGGQIHIITPYGSTVYYNISKKGELGSPVESPDIYLEYISAGGKQDKNTFIKSLITLLD